MQQMKDCKFELQTSAQQVDTLTTKLRSSCQERKKYSIDSHIKTEKNQHPR